MGLLPKHFVIVAAVVILSVICRTAATYGEITHKGDEAGKDPIVVGYSSQVFSSVDPKDVVALTKVWMELVDRKMNHPLKTRVIYFDNVRTFQNALSTGKVDIAVLLPEEFVYLRRRIPLEPVLSADYGKNFYDELLLLVRSDSGISNVGQLRNKRLKIQTGQKGTIPLRWLDSVLRKKGASDTWGFFSTVQEDEKAFRVVLPVFFGQADACVANRTEFDMLAELNPQISKRLKVLVKSPGFLTGIIALRKDCTTVRHGAVLDAIQHLNSEPRGKQLLTLFRINRLIPFKAEHLVSVEQLLRDNKEYTNRAAQGKR